MTQKELAGDGEGSGAFLARDFATAAAMFANLHSERPGDLVEVGAIARDA